MISFEQDGQIDLMSIKCLTEINNIESDPTIELPMKMMRTKKYVMLSSAFCGTCLGILKSYTDEGKYCQLGKTIQVEDETDIEDGIYVYLSTDPTVSVDHHDKISEKIPGTFMLKGSCDDEDNMYFEAYFGTALIERVNIVVNGINPTPQQILSDSSLFTDKIMKDAFERCTKATLDIVAMTNLIYAKGYIDGQKMRGMFE